jgi:hypothetical protein
MIHTYTRAQTIPRLTGRIALATADDARLHHLMIAAKIARILASRLPYAMKLAAINSSDTRKGRAGV